MGKVDGCALWMADPVTEWLPRSIGEVLLRAAEHHGNRPFLHWSDDGASMRTLDYEFVLASSQQMARSLNCHLERQMAGVLDAAAFAEQASLTSPEYLSIVHKLAQRSQREEAE